jgi:hypothetical protein
MRMAFFFACHNRLRFCRLARALRPAPGPCEECGYARRLAVIEGVRDGS